jgi:hypothetical protein
MATFAAIISSKEEELGNYLRKIFREIKVLGGKKIIVFIVSDVPYWEIIKFSREAILDNIDLGLELFVFNKNEISKLQEKIIKNEIKGILIYCSENRKYIVRKILESMPNSIISNIIRDYCK